MAHFTDTNIAVYALLPGPKADRALAVLSDATISVQVLNEFANVALRKLSLSAADLALKIVELRSQVSVIAIMDESTHDLAREIADRYRLSFYDCLIVASALLSDCDTLYSEDMQHGLVIEGRLTIIDPFV